MEFYAHKSDILVVVLKETQGIGKDESRAE